MEIAVVVSPDARYARELVRGICAWARPRGIWSLHLAGQPRRRGRPWDREPAGALGYFDQTSATRRLDAAGIPTIDLTPRPGRPAWMPHLDEAAVGRLAAGFLLERGFSRFAAVGLRSLAWVGNARVAGFRACCPGPLPQAWVDDGQESLAGWLRLLPAPCGVFCVNDWTGVAVAAACRSAGLAVPDLIGLVGCDDDEVLCELAEPPLSSVAMPHAELGVAAAVCLDRLLRGEEPGPGALLSPHRVVERASTSAAAVDDLLVAGALGVIRSRCADPLLGVDAIAAACNVHRRRLERRFRSVLGRSVLTELRRARVARARAMVGDAGMTAQDAARALGLAPSSLRAACRSLAGCVPRDWRRRGSPAAGTSSILATHAPGRDYPGNVRKGFTLVEMLAASAIFAVGFVAVFSLFLLGVRYRSMAEDITRLSLASNSILDELALDAGRDAGGGKGPFAPSDYIGNGRAKGEPTAIDFANATPDEVRLYPYPGIPGTWYRVISCGNLTGDAADLASPTLHLRLFLVAATLDAGNPTFEELKRRYALRSLTDPPSIAKALVDRGLAMDVQAAVVRRPHWLD